MKQDEIFFKWLPVILILLALFTAWMLYKNVMAGTYTTNDYFYKPSLGEYGTTNKGYYDAAMNRADRGIKSGNVLNMSVEYPVTNDEFTLRKMLTSIEIKQVVGVIVCDEANPWIKINISHDGFRNDSAPTELWNDDQIIDSITSGDTITDFDEENINTNDWVWLTIEGVSGNIKEFSVTIGRSIK